MKSNKILAIGLDAAEPSLIEKWMDEGYLQNLARLRSNGSYGRLASSADWLVGSTWPTFYTGTYPHKHGFYHYLQWNSNKMDYERPSPDWISVQPFWRQLDNVFQVIAVDIPLAYPPTAINGIEISGWAAHDRIYPVASFPKEKINLIIKNFGKPLISDEVGGLQKMDELLKLKNELIIANMKEAEILTSLIKNEEWDLFLCCFASTHRGGHKFWTISNEDGNRANGITNVRGEYSGDQETEFKNSLKEIYISCDKAIGNILTNIDDSVTVIIFSLHGMGANTNLSDKILPQLITKILSRNEKVIQISNTSYLKTIRDFIPLELRSAIRKLLPFRLQDKMTTYWRMGKIDWTIVKAFSLVADLQGYIRINLKGREKEGIVEQSEYDHLCATLIDGLKSFHDENRVPIVESIIRSDCLFLKEKGLGYLPDILVKWNTKPAANYKKIISSQYGEVEWQTPGLNPDGRSGNHRPEGFFLAAGNKINVNITIKKNHIVDLAPTILHLLDAQIPEDFDGKVIQEILH